MIPLLYLAPVAWSSLWQRPQQLAVRLAQHFAVHYADAVGLRSARLGDLRRLRQCGAAAPADAAPLPVLRPRYLPFLGLPGVEAFNRRWLLQQVQAAFPLDRGAWILWTGTPNLLADALIDRHRPACVVYDCMDRYAAFHRGRTAERIERDERRLVERADVVFATSQALAERLRPLHPQVIVSPNGVEFDRFALAQRPPAPDWRRRIAGPVIGYHGTIGDWLDFDLIESLARQRPDWSFVFIGPNHARRAARCFALDNVHHLGPLPYRELPAHAAHFDVGIVPFAINELTRHVHPIKALEYLALGLPVVSAPLAELAGLAGVVRFADTPERWQAELTAALEPEARSARQIHVRRAAAQSRSWDQACEQIVSHLANFLPHGTRSECDSEAVLASTGNGR